MPFTHENRFTHVTEMKRPEAAEENIILPVTLSSMTNLVAEQRKSGEAYLWRDTQTSMGNVGVWMKPLDPTDPTMVQWVLGSSCCMTMPGLMK